MYPLPKHSAHSPFFAITVAIFIALFSFIALPSQASHVVPQTISVELKFQTNPENGGRIYEVCASCHLPDGWGNDDGVYPQLAGQHASVLMQQLLDIRDGSRDNPVMYPFVQERTIGGYQNLADVVAYISTLPMTPHNGKGQWGRASPKYQQGKDLFHEKCAICHGQQAEGQSEARIPRLQGQHYAYLVRQARMIGSEQRKADPAMVAVLHQLDMAAVEKIINYISWIPVPPSDLFKQEVTQ